MAICQANSGRLSLLVQLVLPTEIHVCNSELISSQYHLVDICVYRYLCKERERPGNKFQVSSSGSYALASLVGKS